MNARYSGPNPIDVLENVLSSAFASNIANGHFSLLDELFEPVSAISNYPPYNAVYEDKDTIKLEFALAGFSKNDIQVSLLDNKLTVASKTQSATSEDDVSTPKKSSGFKVEFPHYFRRGVALRDFNLSFTIPKDFKVNDPKMDNGLLTIIITRVNVEKPKATTFNIK